MDEKQKLLCVGDSIMLGYMPLLERCFAAQKDPLDVTVLNAAVWGDDTRDILKRLGGISRVESGRALIGVGINDISRGVGTLQYAENLRSIIKYFQRPGVTIYLATITPVVGGIDNEMNQKIRSYNQVIRDFARDMRIRLVDLHSRWEEDVSVAEDGLSDGLHLNEFGAKVCCEEVVRCAMRTSMIVLWQYKGNPCACNYACPYCRYDPKKQIGDHFKGPIERWHQAFKDAFGNQHMVFYFGHGEPMLGAHWFEVVDMVGSEPEWEMRCITNLSLKLDRLLSSRVAREGRLNINASFHPTETTKEDFLAQLLQCREAGIEVPVVYTMYPPFFERFKDDIDFFNKRDFLVHVRRFAGQYKGKVYPEGYTDAERRVMSAYCDDITIKYMLSHEPTDNKPTWTGVDFAIVDNEGNVGYCDDYGVSCHSFGNIFEGNLRLYQRPEKFPYARVSDGTVDGVANVVEIGYPQLRGNHIMHFSRLGGVEKTERGIVYKNLETDFTDPRVRTEYRFPARNIVDAFFIMIQAGVPLRTRGKRVIKSIFPQRFATNAPVTPGAVAWEVLRSLFFWVPFRGSIARWLKKLVRREGQW